MTFGADSDPGSFERDERRRRRRTAWVIAAVVLGPLGWIALRELQVWRDKRAARLTDKTELSALLDRREALGEDRVARWNAAAQREAFAGLTVAGTDCPVKLTPPSQFSAGAYVKYATHDEAFGAWSLCILRVGAASASCARTYQTTPAITALRARLSEGDVYTWDLDEARAAPPAEEAPSTVVVVDSESPASVQSGTVGRPSFLPGTLSGHVFLYALEQGRFICGGELSVRNSKKVDIEYSHFGDAPSSLQAEEEGRAALERDLEVQLRFAVPGSLRQLQGR